VPCQVGAYLRGVNPTLRKRRRPLGIQTENVNTSVKAPKYGLVPFTLELKSRHRFLVDGWRGSNWLRRQVSRERAHAWLLAAVAVLAHLSADRETGKHTRSHTPPSFNYAGHTLGSCTHPPTSVRQFASLFIPGQIKGKVFFSGG